MNNTHTTKHKQTNTTHERMQEHAQTTHTNKHKTLYCKQARANHKQTMKTTTNHKTGKNITQQQQTNKHVNQQKTKPNKNKP